MSTRTVQLQNDSTNHAALDGATTHVGATSSHGALITNLATVTVAPAATITGAWAIGFRATSVSFVGGGSEMRCWIQTPAGVSPDVWTTVGGSGESYADRRSNPHAGDGRSLLRV